MKVTIASGGSGGPATHAAFLEKELPQHNISVQTVSFSDMPDLPPLIRHFWYGVQLHRVARKSDMLYVLDPVSVGVPTCIVATFLKKKFILRVGGDYAWEQGVQRFGVKMNLDTFIHKQTPNPFIATLRWIQKIVAKRACHIIAPSKYLKEIIVSWGITPDIISVVYSAVEPPQISGTKEVLKSVMQFEGNLIVSAGRLVPWKGFVELVEVMPHILKKKPNTRLVIAGDGPERHRIEKMIAKYSLDGVVILTGSLDDEVLHGYIRAADVFILNSSYEGFPHQLLEVMYLGTPIVTARVGGVPEIITTDDRNSVFSVGDRKALIAAIVKTLSNTNRRGNIDAQRRKLDSLRVKSVNTFSHIFKDKCV